MNKKIVIFSGSPREKGNTSSLIRAFSEGAQSSGNTVTTFILDKMDIHGCKGCYGGTGDKNSPCVQKDDMDKIYSTFTEADVFVMASPLYFWTFTGQLRTAIDRLFALQESNLWNSKDCFLIMTAGEDGFGDCVTYYDRLMGNLGWKDRGKILAGFVSNEGDVEGRQEMDEARRLGASI